VEQILDLKVKVTGNENVKIVFHVYIRQKWVDLHQTKTKMTNVHRSILHISSRLYFTSGNISFLWYLSNYLWGDDSVSQRPAGRAPTVYLL